MTQSHGARGAIDLSTLGTQPQSPAGRYVVEVDAASFDQTMQGSLRYPIVIEFYSPRAPEAAAVSADLAALATEGEGRWLLARVNVDTAAQIAQALQVQAVPTVVGVVSGQLVPLWQGTLSKAEAGAYISELLRLAAQHGVVGRAQPVAGSEAAAGADEPAVDPKYAAAYDAMEQEQYGTAVAEFEKILATTPGDAEATAGRAMARMFTRVTSADPQAVLTSLQTSPDDLDSILAAADIEAASGSPERAFQRLLSVIRERSGDERNTARLRLLELFDAFGPADPAVLRARRDLATALF